MNIAFLQVRAYAAARSTKTLAVALIAALLVLAFAATPAPFAPTAFAGSTYADLSAGNLNFSITASNANVIASNDDWSGFASVAGYFGQNLTASHGVDPQTVLGTEFASNGLPAASTQVNANKGNPSAYNAGGLTEFDRGPSLAIGFQGNVQANPYLVFFVNTLGRSNVTITYDIIDIDTGSNDAVSPVALQYRVGSTGLFTNLPAGYIADATDGPNLGGRTTTKSVTLPAAASNQPQVQIRIITTNAANSSGGSTPDEWIGVNNVVVGSLAPSAAPVEVTGRVLTDLGRSIQGAYVSAYDDSGNRQTAVTNSFGYYRFSNLMAGRSYILSVQTRLYRFDPLFITPTDNLSGVNFVSISAAPVSTSKTGVRSAPLLRKSVE
jgi:hypothetical protein